MTSILLYLLIGLAGGAVGWSGVAYLAARRRARDARTRHIVAMGEVVNSLCRQDALHLELIKDLHARVQRFESAADAERARWN